MVQAAAELTPQLLAFARERPLRDEITGFDAMMREQFEMLQPLIRENIALTFTPRTRRAERVQRCVARWPRLKVIFMSGYAPSAVLRAAKGEVPEPIEEDLLLRKPFTAEVLNAKVQEVLGRASA